MGKSFETNVVVEVEDAVEIRIDYNDFTGSVQQWQELYFQVLSWKNTWCLTYAVDMNAYHDNSAYVRIIAKRDLKDEIVDWLECIGYSNVKVDDIEVGVIGIYDYHGVYDFYVED